MVMVVPLMSEMKTGANNTIPLSSNPKTCAAHVAVEAQMEKVKVVTMMKPLQMKHNKHSMNGPKPRKFPNTNSIASSKSTLSGKMDTNSSLATTAKITTLN